MNDFGYFGEGHSDIWPSWNTKLRTIAYVKPVVILYALSNSKTLAIKWKGKMARTAVKIKENMGYIKN